MSARFDEEQVLRMLQENDAMQRRAFGMIVEEFGQQLYWQIRRLVLNHDDANDVLQETLIQAWKNIDYFRGESKLSTWLYRIAINQSLNFLNKQKAQQCISVDNEEASMAVQLESDPYFDGDKAQCLLHQALATLPDKQRLVFNFRYFDELTYTEISEIIGSSVGALKADYHLAVKKISKFLEEVD
ncbi:MAG: RNA polymerase sigma factor [Bacteroidaceae bacterium]|nr:RNA polymerase sigma factor [Bacteroidaceae bacterium]